MADAQKSLSERGSCSGISVRGGRLRAKEGRIIRGARPVPNALRDE